MNKFILIFTHNLIHSKQIKKSFFHSVFKNCWKIINVRYWSEIWRVLSFSVFIDWSDDYFLGVFQQVKHRLMICVRGKVITLRKLLSKCFKCSIVFYFGNTYYNLIVHYGFQENGLFNFSHALKIFTKKIDMLRNFVQILTSQILLLCAILYRHILYIDAQYMCYWIKMNRYRGYF